MKMGWSIRSACPRASKCHSIDEFAPSRDFNTDRQATKGDPDIPQEFKDEVFRQYVCAIDRNGSMADWQKNYAFSLLPKVLFIFLFYFLHRIYFIVFFCFS